MSALSTLQEHCLAEGFFVHAFVMFSVIHITCKCKTNIKKAQQNFFDLDTYFSKRRILSASKRDLEFRPLWTELGFFCLPRFWSTNQAAEACFLAYRLIKSGESYPFIQSKQLVISPEHWNYTSVSTKLFRGIVNSTSFDLSITALVLILDISRLTRLLRESSCHANRWTDNTRLFRALQSRNWNTRFCSTKKKLKGKRKRPKKWNYTLIKLCHPVKCIHHLSCLHFERSCSLLIAELLNE